jgi:hypothetical protein
MEIPDVKTKQRDLAGYRILDTYKPYLENSKLFDALFTKYKNTIIGMYVPLEIHDTLVSNGYSLNVLHDYYTLKKILNEEAILNIVNYNVILPNGNKHLQEHSLEIPLCCLVWLKNLDGEHPDLADEILCLCNLSFYGNLVKYYKEKGIPIFLKDRYIPNNTNQVKTMPISEYHVSPIKVVKETLMKNKSDINLKYIDSEFDILPHFPIKSVNDDVDFTNRNNFSLVSEDRETPEKITKKELVIHDIDYSINDTNNQILQKERVITLVEEPMYKVMLDNSSSNDKTNINFYIFVGCNSITDDLKNKGYVKLNLSILDDLASSVTNVTNNNRYRNTREFKLLEDIARLLTRYAGFTPKLINSGWYEMYLNSL